MSLPTHAQSLAPQGITLQGRIIKPDSTPLEAASVTFTIEVRSPDPDDCLLYTENQTQVMTGSSGIFSFSIGSGSRSGTNFENVSTLAQVFNNASTTISPVVCTSGATSYSPVSTHKRKVRLSFDDGSGPQLIAQAMDVQSVPYALYADTLQGKPASGYLQVNTTSGKALSQANLESVFQSSSYVTELLALIAGTSTQYATSGGGGGNFNFGTGKLYVDGTSGNVGVGTATPAYLLDVSKSQNASTTINVANANGGATAAANVLTTSDAGTTQMSTVSTAAGGYGRISSNSQSLALDAQNASGFLSFRTGAAPTERMRITSNGNVGIGTTSPSFQLQLVNPSADTTMAIGPSAAATSNAFLYLIGKDSGVSHVAYMHVDNGGNLNLTPDSTKATTIRKGDGTAILTAIDSGNVGIGTTAPGAQLEIKSASTTGQQMLISRNTNSDATTLAFYPFGFWSPTNSPWYLGMLENASSFSLSSNDGTSTVNRLTVDTYGNVGIGTTAPGAQLDVLSATPAAATPGTLDILKLSRPSNGGAAWPQVVALALGTYDTNGFGTSYAPHTRLDFRLKSSTIPDYTPDATVMTLQDNGNVGIGTTAPSVSLDLGSKTDALRLPNGTTAQEPASPTAGLIRYNTNSGAPPGWVEFYNGSAWINLVGSSTAGNLTNVGNITGTGAVTISPGGTTQNLNLSNTTGGAVNVTTSAGNIVLQPGGAGSVTVPNATASIGTTSGALIIGGGVGVAGAINAGGAIATSSTISAGTSLIAPALYGSTLASQNLSLDSTSNATKGNVLIAQSGGNVGIGTASPVDAFSIGTAVTASSTHALVNLNNTALSTGSVNGTYLGLNAPLASRADFIDYQSGGTPVFTVDWTGTVYGAAFNSVGFNANIAYDSHVSQTSFTSWGNTYITSASTGGNGNIILMPGGTGNVGIGTTTPSGTLHVAGGTAAAATDGTNITLTAQSASSGNQNGGNIVINGGAKNGTGTAGSLLVGASSPPYAGFPQNSLYLTGVIKSLSGISTGNGTAFGWDVNTARIIGASTSSSSDYVGIETNSLRRLTVDGSGNVGIGTTTPGATLDVARTTGLASGFDNAFQMTQTASPGSTSSGLFRGGYSTVQYGSAASSPSAVIRGIEGYAQNVYTGKIGTAEGVNGNVSSAGGPIGTARGGIFGVGAASTIDNAYGVYISTVQGSNKWSLFANDSTAPSYFAGNVGIGTAAPMANLDVTGINGAAMIRLANNSSNANTQFPTVSLTNYSGGFNGSPLLLFSQYRGSGSSPAAVQSGDALGYIAANGANGVGYGQSEAARIVIKATETFSSTAGGGQITFYTTANTTTVDSPRMVIDNSGNVGIGTTSPSTNLHVVGNLRVQGSTDCTLGNGAGGTNCTSDSRLKEHVVEIENALDKILSLRGVEFDWNTHSQSPGRHDIGVIAQDVERVFPTAVIEDSSTGYKKVDYAVLVAPLIQSVKNLNEQNRSLKSANEEIKSANKELSARLDRQEKEIALMRRKLGM